MPSDLSIPRIGAATAPEAVTRSRTPALPEKGLSGAPALSTAAATAPGTGNGTAGKSLPNPKLRLDPGLAIVVIEFRNETGAVRSTIPTEQQLDAYRRWDRGNIGEAPPGGRDGGTSRSSGAGGQADGAQVSGGQMAGGKSVGNLVCVRS